MALEEAMEMSQGLRIAGLREHSLQNWLWKRLWRCRKACVLQVYGRTAWPLKRVSIRWYKLYYSVSDATGGQFQPPFSDCLMSFSVQSGQKTLLNKALGRQDICRTFYHFWITIKLIFANF
jgi:hypothetical protein